jgi:hypothetical protein
MEFMQALKELSAVRIIRTGEVGIIIKVDDSGSDEEWDGSHEIDYQVAAAETRWYTHAEVAPYIFNA